MTIKIEDLKAGDILYDVHRHKAGNTTMSVEGCWHVVVREVGVDEQGPWALLAWNGNAPRSKTRHFTKFTRWPKEWIRSDLFGPPRCHMCGAAKESGHRSNCDHPAAVRKREAEVKRIAKETRAAEQAAKREARERAAAEKSAIEQSNEDERFADVNGAILHYRVGLGGLAWVTGWKRRPTMLPDRYYDTLPAAATAARESGIPLRWRCSDATILLPIAGIGGH